MDMGDTSQQPVSTSVKPIYQSTICLSPSVLHLYFGLCLIGPLAFNRRRLDADMLAVCCALHIGVIRSFLEFQIIARI